MQRPMVALCLGILASATLIDRASAAEATVDGMSARAGASPAPAAVVLAQATAPAKNAAQPNGTQPVPLPPAVAVPKPEPVARAAVVDGDLKRTRFVADLSQAVSANVFTLADPYRVIVELPQISFQLPQGQGAQTVGLVKGYRFGVFAPGRSRIVLDVTGPVLVENVDVTPPKGNQPARLSLDLVPTDRSTFLAGQSRQMMSSATGDGLLKTVKPPLPANARPSKAAKKPVIVIDPGHGGHDGGANKNGTIEKEVVLAFGLMLRDKLRATGRYEILMTRDTDTFVDLDSRREFANKHGAALFMAIHADYVPGGANVRGATIYTLRDSVARSLSRSRDPSGGADVGDGIEIEQIKDVEEPGMLKKILADLAGREHKPTQERTNFFAKNLIEYMGQSTELKPEPHREAAFRVLKSAQVPSVLIELAYVSNRQDAALLKSDEWRDKVSASLVGAVNRYFSMARLPL